MQACSPHEPDPAADLASRGQPRWLAIALDQIPADEETAALVRGAQVGAIVRLTPLVMAASCVNAAILLAFFDALDVLRLQHWIWAIVFLALALGHMRAWRSRRRRPKRTASRRTSRRLVLNGAALGAVWGYIPAVTFAGAPTPVQLFVTCMTAGMMAAGSFVLTPAPLAAMSYVLVMAAGAEVALWRPYSAVHLAMTGLLISYVAVLLGNINWGAALFVDSRLAEAQVRREAAAREEAQAQAAHAERMTAIGELAGGIAHDINNILQVVSGSAARIERDRPTARKSPARRAAYTPPSSAAAPSAAGCWRSRGAIPCGRKSSTPPPWSARWASCCAMRSGRPSRSKSTSPRPPAACSPTATSSRRCC